MPLKEIIMETSPLTQHDDSHNTAVSHGRHFFHSKTIAWVFFSVVGVIIALVVFWAGMLVGFRKASFSYEWGSGYYENFVGSHGGMRRGVPSVAFMDAHGAAGVIITLTASSSMVIQGRDGNEKIIVLDAHTILRQGDATIATTALQAGDHVVVIGAPNQSGQIAARFIRVVPASVPFPFIAATSTTSSTPH